jgi:cystathionine beta-lyase/cystathionine gamma-synthase
MTKLDPKAGLGTIAIHGGQEPDPTTGAVMTPIYQTSTYAQEALGKNKGYEYARTHNATRAALERNLAALEGAKHGLSYSSGLAATNTLMQTLSAGDHVVCGQNTYGGTFRLFDKVWRRHGLEFTFVDAASVEKIAAAFTPATRMVFVETPTNPLMQLTDIAAGGGGGQAPRHPGDRGQHVHDSLLPAAVGARRRCVVPFGHQVPEWPQRHGRRRAARERRRTA